MKLIENPSLLSTSSVKIHENPPLRPLASPLAGARLPKKEPKELHRTADRDGKAVICSF